MIKETREAFFARHGVQPCRYCMSCERPGQGIGPIIAGILFESYARMEADRLRAKLDQTASASDYNERRAETHHALYIRACWLANIDPDQADGRSQAPRPKTKAATSAAGSGSCWNGGAAS